MKTQGVASSPSGRTGRWASTVNMELALQTMFTALNAGEGVPRLVTFSGPSGFGKTIACSHVAAVTDAVYVEAKSVWTHKTLLEKLAHELGVMNLKSTASAIVDQIIEASMYRPSPFIIDEMDYLVKKNAVDLIRDIHDATGVPIMMVGEEALPAKLKEWERFDNRILKSTLAMPATPEDGRLLRDVYAGDVAIADDLVDHFTAECGGVTRRIVTNLQEAQRVAVEELDSLSIGLSDWGNRPVANGMLPGLRGMRR